jgi:hypothetical protein
LHVVAGSALYVGLIAMLGLALGAIVRSTAGATGTLFGLLFVPPVLAEAFPANWHRWIQEYAPLNAGLQIMKLSTGPDHLGPWTGLGVLALYVGIAVVAAFVVIGWRDV